MEHKTGIEDQYVIKNNKKMRLGYTTGSCAAGAAGGAARILLGDHDRTTVELLTPKGILLNLQLLDIRKEENRVSCAVQKDAGDDPDTTNGIMIYASVEKRTDGQIVIDGGQGVGRVTRPGLWQKPGEAAINRVPLAMIRQAVEDACEAAGYEDGLTVIISVPDGEERAKKTFNPRLGILGGISILGTSGIVEPMSEAALIESIRVEMKQKVCQGEEYLIITPGNYGADYLREHMDLPFEKNMKCSNYVGETIDMAVGMGVKGILFISHIGKFVKVGAGIMNTHSHHADGRMEVLAASAVRAGAEIGTVRDILEAGTTDEALAIIEAAGYLEPSMKILLEKIQFYLDHRSYEQILLGAVIFNNVNGFLGMTAHAPELIRLIRERNMKEVSDTLPEGD